MRFRTPSFIWIPFVFSIGTISWALLVASLGVLSMVVITPALQEVKAAETRRNNAQATVELYDEAYQRQAELIAKAPADLEITQRLASRRLGIERTGQETLVLHPGQSPRDLSVQRLIADSLQSGKPNPVTPLPWYLAPATHGPTRTLMVMAACAGLAMSFFIGVRYEKRAREV